MLEALLKLVLESCPVDDPQHSNWDLYFTILNMIAVDNTEIGEE